MSYESRIPAITKELPLELDIAERESAEVIAELAKQLCPVGTGRIHLRDAIHVDRAMDVTGMATRVVAWSRDAWYGHLVEWGSKHHTIHAGEWIVAPHPFLTPASEMGRPIAVKRANEAIRKAAEAG